MKNLLIVGAGGFAREVYGWIPPLYRVVGFYAEEPPCERINSLRVFRENDIDFLMDVEFIVAIGDPKVRQRLFESFLSRGIPPCKAITTFNVTTGYDIDIGPGSILCPGSVLTTNIKIGRGAIINLNCTIGHDVEMGDFVTLSPGVNVSGNVKVGSGSYLGTNSCVREKVEIGSGSTLGMGAALTRNLPSGECWVGVPAKNSLK